MFRKTFIILFTLVFLLGTVAAASAGKSYYAERFDVDLTIQAGGILEVVETVGFKFEGGPFTYAFRDLNYTNLDAIDHLEAFMDGQPLSQGTGTGQVEVQAGNPLKVTWHFAPTSDDTHTFTLHYRVHGAVQQSSQGDRLIWRAIPETHEYTIRGGTITVHKPDNTSFVAPPALSVGWVDYEETDDGIVFTFGETGSDTPVDITTIFPSGSLVSRPPEWQAYEQQRRADIQTAVPFGIGAGLVSLLAGAAGLWFLGQQNRRESFSPPNRSLKLASPPQADLAPGLAARLAGHSFPAQATIFDLANRGILAIERETGFLGAKKYAFTLQPHNQSLAPHEQGLLDTLFTTRRGQQTNRISFEQASSRLASQAKAYTEPLDEELAVMGWLDPEEKRRSKHAVAWGLASVVLALMVGLAGMIWVGTQAGSGSTSNLITGAVLVGIGAAGFLLSIGLVIYGGSISIFTNSGQQQAASWKSFEKYMQAVSRGKEAALRPDAFGLYLPLAAGFGLASQWAKYFEKMGGAQVPAWFRSLDGKMLNFSDVTAVIVATNASSGAAGSAGAAGASGGGASGAG